MGDPAHYDIIFDLTAGPYQPPLFVLVWTILLGTACLLGSRATRGGWRLLPVAGALGVIAFGAFQVYRDHEEFVSMRRALEDGRATAIEGVVRDFQADATNGNGAQTFTVADERFIIRSSEISPAFRQTVSGGGPDLTGKCVRTLFVRSGVRSQIVWLGIRRDGCAEG